MRGSIDDVWGWGVSRRAALDDDARVPLLDVPAIGQETGWECGNTCLAAVAGFFGRNLDPAAFARLAGTTRLGTDHDNMRQAAIASGAIAEAKPGGTIAELAAWLERGVPPIVGWWSMEPGDRHWRRRWNRRVRRKKDCGHYSVVKGIDANTIVLMDPQDDGTGHTWSDHRIDRATFDRLWYDTDTSRYIKTTRWFLAIRYPA